MNNLRDETNIDRIMLMLGGNCNFKCRHCISSCVKLNQNKNIDFKVIKYLWHLIKIRDNNQQKLRIVFFGGEPLLYKDTIRKIVKEFHDSVDYGCITNGSLIDDEWVEFCNSNNIGITISNDGVHTAQVRGVNILDNPKLLDRIGRLNNKSINGIIHAYNQDYLKFFEYIRSKLGNDISISTEFLRYTWVMPDDILNFNLPEYEKSLNDVANIAYRDILEGKFSAEVSVFFDALDKIACGADLNRCYCGRVVSVIPIDLDGNIYACQNCSDIVGTVEDTRVTLLSNYHQWAMRKPCGVCPLEIENKMQDVYTVYFKVCNKLAERLINSVEKIDLGE